MTADDPQRDLDPLIGYLLGLSDEAECTAFEHRYSTASRTQAGHALGRILAPLDAFSIPPSDDLPARILAESRKIERTLRLPPSAAATHRSRPDEPPAAAGRGSFSLRDLLSAAAVLLIFAGLLLPGYRTARSSALRTLCEDQVRRLGQGYHGYAQAHAGVLPFVDPPTPARWPLDRAEPLPSNAAGRLILYDQGYVASRRHLSCPAQDDPGSDQSGYSSQPFVRPQSIYYLSPAFPIASDPNPLVRRGVFVPVPERRNSDGHGPNAGQIVLRLDGSAAWRTQPTVGIGGDDIFRIDNRREFEDSRPIRSISDSFLIP